ncbi:MAG: phosphoadenosine phosphosulfate reductase family protein [Candidatus Aenigmatarchaeota archaeon]
MGYVYWCYSCNVPLTSSRCNLCKNEGKRCSTDIKPVFLPEFEILVGKLPDNNLISCQLPLNLFRCRNKLIVNGKILSSFQINANAVKFSKKMNLKDVFFDKKLIEKTIEANAKTLQRKELQAIKFIKKTTKLHKDKKVLVSFSGGKDSTVTSYLVYKALENVTLIFSNTGIEYPETVNFVRDFAKIMNFELIELKPPKDFFDLCEELGPPSRMMRWCCFTQKSSPINEFYATLDKPVLSFDGIRKNESKSRAKFERIRKNTKIIMQYSAYPIFDWMDFEVWSYVLWRNIPVNPLYFYGFNRIGCWVCPNNGKFDDFLLKRVHPELYEKWNGWLIKYAGRNNKTHTWVHKGAWKQRKTKYKKFGAYTIQMISPSNFIISLKHREVDEELLEFFKIFGEENKKIVCNQTFVQFRGPDIVVHANIGGSIIKVKVNSTKNQKRKMFEVIKQLEKALNCVNCGACLGSCPYGAIKIEHNKFRITSKCAKCLTCVTSKFLKQSCVALHYKSNRKTVYQIIMAHV